MSTKEELIQRALDTTVFASHIHEDLSDLVTMLTPSDVPMFQRLRRARASALLHEWTETALTATFTNGKYADGSLPVEHTNTHNRVNNKVMSVGRVAKATALLNALNTVGAKDAFAREIEEKIQDTLRVMEYYIWQGSKAVTGTPECDGLLNWVTAGNGSTVVNNNAAKLVEANLRSAIVGCYDQGGSPNVIAARPEVAYQIANFNADKVRFAPGGGPGGVDNGTLRYLSPFGNAMEVIPVRSDFLTSGNVLVLDTSKLALAFASNGIEMTDLPLDGDVAGKKLVKAYFTLEVRGVKQMAVIQNVLD